MNDGNAARAVLSTLFMDFGQPPDRRTGAACGAGGKAVQGLAGRSQASRMAEGDQEGGKGGQFRPKTDAERFGIGGNNGPPLEGESSPSGKIMTRALAGAIKGAIRGGWAGAVVGAVSEKRPILM